MSRLCAALAMLVCACSSRAPDPAWMADLPDARRLTELSLPGTHDSGAMFEPYMGIAKTQTLTLAEQLDAGVRYFDIRCHDDSDAFLIFHGAIDQNQTFDQVLATMSAFLAAHPTEAVVMSIKEEAMAVNATRSFEATFATYLPAAPWYTAAAVPTLGEVRGKLVLLRRFDATAAPLGIDASVWPDNTTFTSTTPASTLRVEDNYVVASDDMKWAAISALLAEARAGDPATLYLTYTSGYQNGTDGLPNIPSVSDTINANLDALLADPANAQAHLGTLAMDFATADRVAAVIRTNGP